MISVPAGVLEFASRGPAWAAWVDRLPKLAAALLEEWDLELDGDSMYGFCSLVLPVRTSDGLTAVLKLHTDVDAEESDHEHLALQRWGGDGAVRLLRADPARRALLLERLHQRDLTDLGDLEACEIVVGLYARIHVPALPQLRAADGVRRALDRRPGPAAEQRALPHRLVEQAVSLGRDFVAIRRAPAR